MERKSENKITGIYYKNNDICQLSTISLNTLLIMSTMNNITIDKISILKFHKINFSRWIQLIFTHCTFKKFTYYTLNLIPSPYFEGTKWD